MCVRELPVPEQRAEQVQGVEKTDYRDLIERCIANDSASRPTASDVLAIFQPWVGELKSLEES